MRCRPRGYIHLRQTWCSVNKVKVLMMLRMPEPPVTGGEIYYSKLRQYLQDRSVDVDNYSWQMKPYKGPFQYILGSVLKNLCLLRHLRSISSNTVIMEDVADSPDLFLFNAVTRVVRGFFGKKIYIVPVVHHLESPLIKKKVLKRMKLLEESIFFSFSDGVVVNSKFTQKLVENSLSRDVGIVLAYPGLNVSGLGKDLSKDLGKDLESIESRHPDKKCLHLLFVGYVTSRKGVDTLIKAFEILVKEKGQENLALHVVGNTDRDKAFSQKVKDYSREAGLDGQVIFHGRINDRDMEELYMTSDIFVFPSLWEGFGMVLAEAASFGLPIVTTDAGAIPYLIKDGVNGLLVPPGDAEGLARAIERLAKSPEMRARFGEDNRKMAEEFDWNKSFSKIEGLLDKLACEG